MDEKQRTSVEDLYAAGDVVSDLHQLSVATGHAAIAATVNSQCPAAELSLIDSINQAREMTPLHKI